MENVELIEIGKSNYRRAHWKRSTLDGVLHVCPPHTFEPFDHAQNFLFSMCEAPGLDKAVVERISKADYHFVPSSFCRSVWAKYGLDAEVVPLGIGPEFEALDASRTIIRGPDSRKLRFLYVGSTDKRKGLDLVAPAFKEAFEAGPGHDVSLYIKSFNAKAEQNISMPYGDDRLIVDTRDLNAKDLADLYGTADVFVFPTFAEGFGLPVLEAMAAGCLTIAPLTGGLTDFFSANTGVVLPKSKIETMNYGEITWREPVQTVQDLSRCMLAAWEFWGTGPTEALRRTGTKIARDFTWDRSTSTLVEKMIFRKRGDNGENKIFRERRTDRSVCIS
jgi:glycosyltransferase involved in cell wall biosynthesis